MKTLRHFLNWSALCFALFCIFSFQLNAQSGIIPPANPLPQATIEVDDLRSWLLNAPKENAGNAKSKIIVIDLPMPDGQQMTFRAVETQMMTPELADAFPQIKTYRITSMLNPMIYGNLTVSPRGMDALIATPEDNVFIEPVSVGSEEHFVYYQRDGSTFMHPEQDMFFDETANKSNNSGEGKSPMHQHNENEAPHQHGESGLVKAFNGALSIGTDLRTYRVHITTKKEYSAQHDGGAATAAARLANVTAVVVAQVNSASLLYERDIAIRLLANTPLVFLDDPMDDNGVVTGLFDGNASLATEALEVYDQLTQDDPNISYDGLDINSFDLGHVFGGTGGNGSAFIGVVCRNTFVNGVGPGKGGGGTQSGNAQGSGWIELFAHEMGHQFSARHTFNSDNGNCALANGQHSTANAVEPGSGVTIMSYRGICGVDNIKEINSTTNARIGFFGINSIEVINDYVNSAQGNCKVDINNNNAIPVANADPCGTGIITIPQRTPFELTGSATDADGDALTYSWEQYDIGTAGIPGIGITENSGDNMPNGATENGAPIFRPRDPMTTPTRQFPVYEKILSGLSLVDPAAVDGEILPIIDRTMTFRMTVRDGKGGVSCVERQVMTSNNAAAFEVVTPMAGDTWNTGGNVTVTWSNGGFLGCNNVNVLLSIDGGNTYPYTLATNEPYALNAWTGILPSNIPNTTQARIRVECADNTCVKFFNISPGDFNIVSSCLAAPSSICSPEAVTANQGDAALNLSLTPVYGNPSASYSVDIDGTDPFDVRGIADAQGSLTCATVGSRNYESVNISVLTSGDYTITRSSPGFLAVSVFEATGFDVSNPCASNFLGSNAWSTGGGGASNSGSFTVTLNECTEYVVMMYASSSAFGTNTLNFSGGDVFVQQAAPVGDYAYTYVAVNTTNDQVTVVDAGADFTTLPGGTFQVYGVSYYNGAGPTPPVVNTANWVGMTLAQIQATDCVVFSTNNKMLTITAPCVADAGDLTTTTATSSFTTCSGSDLLDDAMASAVFAADYTAGDENDPGLGYDYAFVLADATGAIIQTNTTGDFDFTTVTTAGTYDIYGLSYANTNAPTSVTAYLAALSPMNISQIQTDDAGATFCLDFDNLNSGGTAVQVTVVAALTYTVSGTNPTICGTSDGSFTIAGLNNSTTYSVSYSDDGTPVAAANFTSNGSGEITVTGLNAGNYTNIIATLNGCPGPAEMVTLTDPAAPTYTVAGNNPSTCGGTDGNFIISGLTPAVTYVVTYEDDGTPTTLPAELANASGQITVTGLNAGAYTNIVVSLGTCSGAAAMTTLTDPAAPTYTVVGNNPSTCSGTDGTIVISGLMASTTYSVSYADDGTPVAAANFTSNAAGEIIIMNLNAGAYTNIVVTLNGCAGAPAMATLMDPPTPTYTVSSTNPSTCGGTDGTIVFAGLNASTAYMITYDDDGTPVGPLALGSTAGGMITITGLNAGNYTNIIATLNNCAGAPEMETLTDPAIPTYTTSSTNPSSCGGTDGTITISGLMASTSYMVDYDDDGTAIATLTLGSNAAGEITITGLNAGAYTNIIVTLNNCVGAPEMETLTDPAVPTYTTSSTNPSSCGGTDGTITISGLMASTSYMIDYDDDGTAVATLTLGANAAGEITITGLNAGAYTNIIVTLNNCAGAPEMETLTDPAAPTYTTSSTNPSTCGGTDGTILINGLTASTTYSVSYTDDGTPVAAANFTSDATGTITIMGLDAGAYTNIVVSLNGCAGAPEMETLTEPATPTYTVAGSNPTTCGGTDGSFTISGLNLLENYEVSYSDDGTAVGPTTIMASAVGEITIGSLDAGAYTNIIVSQNNCAGTAAMATLADPVNFTDAGLMVSACNDQTTDADDTDDTFTFTLNPTGTDASGAALTGTYSVSGDVTQANVAYGAATTFDNAGAGFLITGGTLTITITDDANGSCQIMNIMVVPPASCSGGIAACSELFFSEYVEGSSNNKCLEIYNPTGAAIDLAAGNYVINRYANGTTTPTAITLTGVIASGDVFVICNPSSDAELLAHVDQTSGTISFNGDDAMELVANGTTIDVFGRIGEDPGSQWSGACGGSANNTFRRMMNIQSGDNDGSDAFDPCVEYNIFPQDDFSGIGGHISTCIPCNIMITSTTPTATSCDGASDGMLVINATTDNGEIEYSTDNGATFQSSNTFTGLADMTYDVVVRVVGEPTCNTTTTATVAAGQAVMLGNTLATDETCAAANDGTITFNSTGPGTLEYSIDGGATFDTNPAFTGLDAGTYNLVVQVQGTAACMDSGTATIGTGAEVMISNVATTNESCAAENDGTITITATGPGTLEYSIDNGATFSTMNVFNMQDAGTYNIVVQSQTNNACTATSTGTIGTDAEVMITDVATTNETCPATDDGTITITATGPGTLEYSIDNGATFQPGNTFTGQDAGTYNVVVRRMGTTNCTATTTAMVGSDSDVMITDVTVVNETCAAANDGSITITATGNGTLEYSIDNGATFSTMNTFTGQDAGTYNIVVQVQGSGVCNDTDVATVGTEPEVMITSIDVVNESCTAANDGTITINATGGPAGGVLEYSIDNGATFSTMNAFTGQDAGNYNVVVQLQGTTVCNDTDVAVVGTNPDVMITMVTAMPTSCDGAMDGSITITATGGGTLEYSIDNGVTFDPSNTFTGLAPNTYNIVVQSMGTPVCMDTDVAVVAAGTAVDITSVDTTPTSCDGATDGTITINATGPGTLEYSIDNGATFSTMNVFNAQAAATYDIVVQVQGTAACNDTETATIAAGTPVVITSVDTTPTSCDGATDGTITINATGPGTLEYSIDNGATFSTMNVFNMQAVGTYDIVVQVQGTAACNDTETATIAAGTAVDITSVDTTPTSCDGETDGTITVNATGPGTLEYSIDNGATFSTTNVFNMQAAGTYNIVVQVQGTAACNDTETATIAAGTAVAITSIDEVNETCAAANDGTITINATGPGTLEYSIDNGVTFVTTNVFTAQDAGTYNVVVQVQGSAACNATSIATVGTDADVMITNVAAVDETCAGANDGSITITATGTGTLEYSIGGAFQPSNTFTGLAPNTYTITVQSQTNNACTATTTATIGTAPDNTPPTAICQDITIDLDLNGDATIVPADVDNGSNDNCGAIALTSVTPNTFTCLNVGPNTVTLVVTDGNTNTDDCTATVNVNASGACVPPMITNEGGPIGFDPCSCRGNGEFDEEVVVEAGTGQTWTIVSTDLINPATMMPYAAGTPLAETVIGAGVSQYTLAGIHLDGVGYSITVDSPSNPGAPLEMSNTCFYPDANFITDLSNDICVNTAPITLEGDGNGAAGTTTFTVNGVTTNIIDPATLGTGSFPVTFTFDAGDAGQFKVTNGVIVGPPEGVNSLAEAEADPGCTETISTFINIVATPTTLGCNNSIQVSLDENCESLITPDMLLEGDYLCFDDYEVSLVQGLNTIPNPLTGANIGQTITGTVTHIESGNSCWSTITVEDKLAPTIDCQEVTIACTADADLVPAPIATDNCDPNPTVTMVDEVINIDNNCDPNPATGDAYTVTIVRTFIAQDNQGNISQTCQQVITVIRPDLIDIPDDLVWSCEQYAAYSYIIDSTRIMPSIASQFGGAIQPFDNTGAWNLTGIALTDPRLTNNVPGTDRPTGSGVPSGIFPLATGNANPLGGALDADYCKYAYSNSDQILSTCGFAASTDSPVFKIVRTWTILDWCTGNVVTDPTNFAANDDDNVQVIKVIDDEGPIVSGADVTINTNITGQHPQPCKATGPIPDATATDNCTGVVATTAFVYSTDPALNPLAQPVAGVENNLLNPALEIGTYFLVYTAEDACGNVAQSTTYTLTIEDNIAPVAVCDEITQVSLSSDGLAVVNATTFDDGSYDNCCLDRLEVRRMTDACGVAGNTTFGETVTFCCADIGNTVMVALQAVDCFENANQCMIEVLVEDKLAPTLVCPPNAALTCDEYADDLAAALLACADATDEDACQSDELAAAGYGNATAFDNCEVTITPTVTVTIDQCGAGSIVRSYTSVDDSGNASNPCTQVITVAHVSDWVVEFPEDQDGFCDMDEPDFGEPEIFFETCELIATSFEDQFFDIVPDACFKIVRQWTVINWCVVGNTIDQEADAVELSEQQLNQDLDGDGDRDSRTFRDSYRGTLPTQDNDPDADNQDGFITYQQLIKVEDDEAPVIDEDFTVGDVCIIDGNDGTDDDFSDCVFNGILPTPTYEDCTLDVNGNLDNNGNVVDNELTITATVFDANGDVVSNSVVVSNLEIGTYTVRYVAVDRCGNTTATDYTFDVNDCKFPTPYCKDGVVLELMHINDPNNTTFEAMVELWASDLDEGSYDNCPGGVQLSFSANVNDIGATFNCDNLGENVVQLWVTDASGNQDFCETFVIIQGNQGQCGDPDPLFTVGGNIATELSVDVADVEVNINGATMNTMEMTDLDGNYSINVPAGGDYTIVPAKDINPLNGVSTFDLVKISKHILNVELLDSPYKMIAADANKSQTITTLDLVQIRKLILLIDDNFTNNTSWRFVDADFVFPDPTNPWATGFPEIININNLPADALSESFVAVKIGDVNGNAQGNQLLGADDRSFDGTLELTTKDVAMKAGENYTVTLNAANFHHFGYQFTLNFDTEKLAIVGLGNGLAKAENFGMTLLEEGAITTSWNNAAATRLSKKEALFTLTFTAKADAQLSDVLSINSRYTLAEAYAENGDLQDIALTFDNENVAAQFELYQNTPNPFAESTNIGFTLPQAGNAVLTIHDAAGRLLKTIDRDFAKGYNEVQISKDELGAKGVLYYQLETAGHTATKKMILN